MKRASRVAARGGGATTATDVARFLLRLPAGLHRRLKAQASAQGRSLNDYCVRTLAAAEADAGPDPAVRAVREHAQAVAGSHVEGLIAHGSIVRGDARTTSDQDVLVVVERSLPLTRALYRKWDERPLTWDGRTVDAHFVHRPADVDRPGGVWCEAAIEGVLWYDRDRAVEATLRQIRRAIAEGRLVRRRAHGQPYWTGAS